MNRSILIGALSLCLSLPALAESPALERTKHALGLPLATPLAVIPTLANTPGRFGAYFKTVWSYTTSPPTVTPWMRSYAGRTALSLNNRFP